MPSLLARHLDEVLADVAVERLFQMLVVAEQVGGGQQRPGRNLLGNVGRRQVAQLQVVALKRDELGALLE